MFSLTRLLRLLLSRGDACLPPRRSISLTQPFGRLYQLDHIDHLLAEHDREADARQDPRYSTVHLVGPRHFQRPRAPRVGKQGARFRMSRGTRLSRQWCAFSGHQQ